MGHSLDPAKISELTGALWAPDKAQKPRTYLHTTNFLINPMGEVNISVYSSGPLGRLVWQDVLQAVAHRKKMAAATGK